MYTPKNPSQSRPRQATESTAARVVRLECQALEERATPAVFAVTNTADTGAGSLRDAITALNGSADATNTINITANGTVTLATALPAIAKTVTIDGPGAANFTVSGNNAVRVFDVNVTGKTAVTIEGMRVTGGLAATDDGGGILTGGFLTLDSVVISGNKTAGTNAGAGVSVRSNGFLRVLNSTISGNISTDAGGGIYFFSGGSLVIQNSTISNNQSNGFNGGGGVYFFGTASATPPDGFTAGTLLIQNTTISGNTTTSVGGAVSVFFTYDSTLSIRNSTITGNTAAGGGGVSLIYGDATVELTSSIISGNTAAFSGGDIYDPLLSFNVVLSNSAIGDTTGFSFNDDGSNKIGDPAALGLNTTLANNGGPTQTHQILTGSLLIDAGSNPNGLATDQRGSGRNSGAGVDIGAVEFDPIPPSILSITSTSANSPPVYGVGATIPITVTFDKPITLTGTLTLTLDSGGTVNITSAAGNSATGTYTVAAGEQSEDLTVTAANVSSGTLTNGDGAPVASLTPPAGTNLGDNKNIIVDAKAPTFVIAPGPGQTDPTNATTAVFSVTFDENVTGFDGADLSFATSTTGGAPAGVVSGSGKSYTVSVTGYTGEGNLVLTVNANAVLDRVNLANAAASGSIGIDTTAPTGTLAAAPSQPDPTNLTPIVFVVEFTEAVTGFTKADILFTPTGLGGTPVATVTGSGKSYTVSVTGVTGTGDLVVSVPAGSYTDTAGNPGAGLAPADVFFTDARPSATVALAPGQASATAAGPIRFTVTFNADVTGFQTNDLILTNTAGGTLVASIAGSGSEYTVTLTGATGTGDISLAVRDNAGFDAFNNGSLPSNTSFVRFDNLGPVGTLSTTAGQPTNLSPYTVSLTFDEDATGLTLADLTVTNGVPSNLSGSGTAYTFLVTPLAEGPVTVTLQAGTVGDALGNANGSASNALARTFDITRPTGTAALAPGQAARINPLGWPVAFQLTFSEPMALIPASAVSVTGTSGGVVTSVQALNAERTIFRVTVSGPLREGTLGVSVADGAVTDTAGNPVVALVSPPITVTATVAPPVTPPVTPPPVSGPPLRVIAASPGNAPLVEVRDAVTGEIRLRFLAYEESFRGGVDVALADANGDGFPDVITSPGNGGGPLVKIFDGRTGAPLSSFFAYESTFRGGVSVAAADVNGDGSVELLIGSGVGGGPRVRVLDVRTLAEVYNYFAYDSNFRGGVTVEAGDLDGDGASEILTAPFSNGGPNVRVFSGRDGSPVSSFFAFDPGFLGGINIAAGDWDGDGRDDIIVGVGSGGGPLVSVFSGLTRNRLTSFVAGLPEERGGVRVGAEDINRDGRDDVGTFAVESADAAVWDARGSGRRLQTFAVSLDQTTPLTAAEFLTPGAALASSLAGVYVGDA